jgi:tRNA (uracil-5-)-methyltransferase
LFSLCRETSKQFRGEPFRIVRAIPVDLFPHTNHCELVLLLARGAALASVMAAETEEVAAAVPAAAAATDFVTTPDSAADVSGSVDAADAADSVTAAE